MKTEIKYRQQPIAGENLLHVELVKSTEIRVILKGDPVVVSKMIATAMDSRQDICAAMIAGVVSWFKEHNIPLSKIGEMVIFDYE